MTGNFILCTTLINPLSTRRNQFTAPQGRSPLELNDHLFLGKNIRKKYETLAFTEISPLRQIIMTVDTYILQNLQTSQGYIFRILQHFNVIKMSITSQSQVYRYVFKFCNISLLNLKDALSSCSKIFRSSCLVRPY